MRRCDYFKLVDLMQLQKKNLNTELNQKRANFNDLLDFYPEKSWNNSPILLSSYAAVFKLFLYKFS